MMLNRLSLSLTSLAFAGFGTWLLVRPETMETVGLALTTPAAYTEVRGFYGGLELGCALFFATRRANRRSSASSACASMHVSLAISTGPSMSAPSTAHASTSGVVAGA